MVLVDLVLLLIRAVDLLKNILISNWASLYRVAGRIKISKNLKVKQCQNVEMYVCVFNHFMMSYAKTHLKVIYEHKKISNYFIHVFTFGKIDLCPPLEYEQKYKLYFVF